MNTERLLGYLIGSGLRSSRPSTRSFNMGGKAGLGMGALGVAMAAFEHFSQQPKSGPGAAASPGSAAVPPPLPSTQAAPPPLPSSEESELLIRAMIAAANSDGVIDSEEQSRIMDAAKASGLSSEELEFLDSEINRPRTMFEIVACATTPELARQVYAASLLVIDVDTEGERTYLRQLASSLHLSAEDVAQIETQFTS